MNISYKTIAGVLCVYALVSLAMVSVYAKKNTQMKAMQALEDSRAVSDPIALMIPKIRLNTSVKPGVYDVSQKTWTITSDFPHFATISEKPNTKSGVTVIYAHNSKALFGSIDTLEKTDTVLVKTKEGKIYTYAYDHSIDVSPTDASIFSKEGTPQLILITCTGTNNSMRKLVFLKFISVI